MGAGSVPRVGTAAWTAARLAWRDRATASARALIAARRAAAGAPPLTDALDAGVHATPAHRSSMSPSDCWPPGASQPRPGMVSRHVIDDAFDPRDLSVLVAAAKTSMNALRSSDGEASAAALGRASEGMLGFDSHVAMRRTLRAMTETARRAVHGVHPVVPGVPAEGDRTEGAHSGDDAPTLRPVGAIFTHVVPGETSVTSVTQSTPIDAHGYWSPHVDKANVPEYDVSAVLYLSDGDGVDFAGGALHFMDASGGWKTVTPRRNRLVVFSSGEENVHAVGVVTSGERTTLNLWLTRDPRVAAAEDDC
jgi:hypothetical protein